jgi:MtN3 and saliva related transmembrane protein
MADYAGTLSSISHGWTGGNMGRLKLGPIAFCLLGVFALLGCESLVPRDTKSLLLPQFQRSEFVGLVAGFGTTFAALPDLIAMLRRRSSAGINPRMSAIMAVFQIIWVYYGLLIISRPVVIWNVIAVVTNSFTVSAYFHFARKEKTGSLP